MLREDIKALRNAPTRQLRSFGLVVGGVFCALALFFYIPKWHKDWFWWFLLPGVPLVLLGAVAPKALRWPFVAWMTLAMILGAIVSTVILVLLFFLLVTPMGWMARMAGKDFLRLKLELSAPSYWLRRDASKRKQKHEHEQQF